MKTEIINIGDELLIGQVVNTNASWMAEKLTLAGFPVHQVSMISDQSEHILRALKESESRSDIILVTGGLGPTKDDLTREALCHYFNTQLIFHTQTFLDIENLFRIRGFQVTDVNRKQAEIPEKCVPIPNREGTAPGMWFEKINEAGKKVIFVFLPGVPFEMKSMLLEGVIPKLRLHFTTIPVIHRTVMTQGIGESFLSDLIRDWEDQLPHDISLAYLPQPGIVRLRLTGSREDEEKLRLEIDRAIVKLEKLVPEYIFGYDEERLEVIVGNLLRERSFTLSTAESCTGGYIAHLITSVPGSSDYYKGSIVAYSNEIKSNELGVSAESLLKYGAVSEQVVVEMAKGIRKKYNTTFAIATSGIAGPGGATDKKPVGTTWIAIATPENIHTQHHLFGENRERNIRKTALQSLNSLRKVILSAPNP